MSPEEKKKLVRLGSLDIKVSLDAIKIIEAVRWLQQVTRIDDVQHKQTVVFTDEEKEHLYKSIEIMREKQVKLQKFMHRNYEKMQLAVYGDLYESGEGRSEEKQ